MPTAISYLSEVKKGDYVQTPGVKVVSITSSVLTVYTNEKRLKEVLETTSEFKIPLSKKIKFYEHGRLLDYEESISSIKPGDELKFIVLLGDEWSVVSVNINRRYIDLGDGESGDEVVLDETIEEE